MTLTTKFDSDRVKDALEIINDYGGIDGAHHKQWVIDHSHLPADLQQISVQFNMLAKWVVESLPRNPERSTALRKLLEAKEYAIRAKLYKP